MKPQYGVALRDIVGGMQNWRIWGRLGWQETKRRYRRTVIGPFWTTLSLSVFIVTLGMLWAQLWKQDPKVYLPFLTAGMLTWGMVSTIITEGCLVFTQAEGLIRSLRFNYTVLSCAVVWRNLIVFLHNLLILFAVVLYADVTVTWYTLLVFPGLLLVSLNGVWIATFLGLVCVRFRDIQQLIATILQVAMFVTPIFWAPEQLGTRYARFVDFNLLFHYVDIVRSPLLGHAPANLSWLMAIAGTVVGWLMTIFVFSHFRRRLPYWL